MAGTSHWAQRLSSEIGRRVCDSLSDATGMVELVAAPTLRESIGGAEHSIDVIAAENDGRSAPPRRPPRWPHVRGGGGVAATWAA